MSKQSEKLKAYRQACFVVTDMDRDDPEDVVRAFSEMQARVEQLQAELRAYTSWAWKIDKWHTELCGLLGIKPIHPANARLQGCERSEHTLQGVVRRSDSGGEA